LVHNSCQTWLHIGHDLTNQPYLGHYQVLYHRDISANLTVYNTHTKTSVLLVHAQVYTPLRAKYKSMANRKSMQLYNEWVNIQ